MAFIRATYDNEIVTRVDDSSQLATDQSKYWVTDDGVNDTLGVWDDVNNKFIPDGWYDELTGWLWPKYMDFTDYNG